jgi:hypothetical protein
VLSVVLALLTSTGAATTSVPSIDGALLPLGDACYAIAPSESDGTSAGSVLRRVERLDDKRLMITIASRFYGGPLLTSRVEVAFPSLRPIRTTEETDGSVGLSVHYGDKAARGTVTGDDGRRKTAKTPLPGPVWDEETMEFVLATLPLVDGAQFEVPVFHFGRGPGVMRIHVRGSAAIGDGSFAPVAAWEVEGSTRSGITITYMIAKRDRRLLQVEVGGIRSNLGGDCSELMK